jgi:hypothetical protein
MNWLLNLFTGGLVGEVKDGLLRAQQQHLAAQNEESAQNLKFWQSRMDLAIAAAQHDKWWSPRSIMGLSVAGFVSKIVLWDSTIMTGWNGVTPDPGDHVIFIVMTVVGFYFASKAAENIASIISNRIAR